MAIRGLVASRSGKTWAVSCPEVMTVLRANTMRQCAFCGERLPEDCLAGDVCKACADRYDEYGVYFCIE